MIDLAKVTFGETTADGFLLTLGSAPEIQSRNKSRPFGFKFRYPLHL